VSNRKTYSKIYIDEIKLFTENNAAGLMVQFEIYHLKNNPT